MIEGARKFQEGLRALAEAGRRAASGVAKLRQSIRRLQQQCAGAPRNFDPADETWQTDLCAAWLHGDCPFPGACDCTCHGGVRR
jgi:hypothetical protein